MSYLLVFALGLFIGFICSGHLHAADTDLLAASEDEAEQIHKNLSDALDFGSKDSLGPAVRDALRRLKGMF